MEQIIVNTVIVDIKKDPLPIKHDGTIEWRMSGEYHRDGGLPAIERKDGTKEWYIGGKRHRDGGFPAIEYYYGTKEWYRNGKLHREDGPAIVYSNGDEDWYLNGVFFRNGRLLRLIRMRLNQFANLPCLYAHKEQSRQVRRANVPTNGTYDDFDRPFLYIIRDKLGQDTTYK